MENLLMSDDGASLELDDKTFTQMAMATHANAYWSAGLGDLPLMDLVKIGLSPDIKHLATGASVSQISEISMLLLDHWKKHPMTGARRGWEAITHMREIKRLVQEYMIKQSVQLGGYPNKEYNENRKAINAIVHKLGIIVDVMP